MSVLTADNHLQFAVGNLSLHLLTHFERHYRVLVAIDQQSLLFDLMRYIDTVPNDIAYQN